MKILTTLTKDYLKIYNEIFIPSLPKNTELITQYFNYDLIACKNKFGSHDTLYKLPFILNELYNSKEDEVVCYADIDIIFLHDNFGKDISNTNFNFQWDSKKGDICLGLMFIRNNEISRNLIEEFLKKDIDWIIKNYKISFIYLKHLLDTMKVDYKYLPYEYYGGQMVKFNIKQPKTIYCYHATYEKTINDKYKKLMEYKTLKENKPILKEDKPILKEDKLIKFLILLFYYNRPKLVRNALESIKNIKNKNWELAIIDDGSEESVLPIVEDILGEYADKIIYYQITDTIEQKNKQGGSRFGQIANKAILESKCDIVIPLCDDDAIHADYLDNLTKYFINNPNVKYAYSSVITFNPETENPFNFTTNRHNFANFKVAMQPAGRVDSSQVVFKKSCFSEDGLAYPYPQTKNLDESLFKQAYAKYGNCQYTGFYGQYKAFFKGQLGARKQNYEYKQ